jgi:hypothetical protein
MIGRSKMNQRLPEGPPSGMWLDFTTFLAHLAKGKVSFCHHLASVSYQVSVHLAKPFQRRRFKKIDQSETRIACGSHVC